MNIEEKKYLESILYYITDFSEEHLALSPKVFEHCFKDILTIKHHRQHVLTINRIVNFMKDKNTFVYKIQDKFDNGNINKDCLTYLSKFITYHIKHSDNDRLILFLVSLIMKSVDSDTQITDFIFNGTKLNESLKKKLADKCLETIHGDYNNSIENNFDTFFNPYTIAVMYRIPNIYKYLNLSSLLCKKSNLTILNKAIHRREVCLVNFLIDIGVSLNCEKSVMNNIYYLFNNTTQFNLEKIFGDDYDMQYYYYTLYSLYVKTDNLCQLKLIIENGDFANLNLQKYNQCQLFGYDDFELSSLSDLHLSTSGAIRSDEQSSSELQISSSDNLTLKNHFSSRGRLRNPNYNVLISEYNTNMLVGCKSVGMLNYLLSIGLKLDDSYCRIIANIDEKLIIHLFNRGDKFNQHYYLKLLNERMLGGDTFYFDEDFYIRRLDTILKYKNQYKKKLLAKLKTNKNIEICDDILGLIVDFI